MTKLMISLTDALTGKNIVREMNAEELANHAIMQAEVIAEEEALTARKIAKAAAQTKLAALGLTTDDLKALGLQHNPPRLCPALLTGQGQSQITCLALSLQGLAWSIPIWLYIGFRHRHRATLLSRS